MPIRSFLNKHKNVALFYSAISCFLALYYFYLVLGILLLFIKSRLCYSLLLQLLRFWVIHILSSICIIFIKSSIKFQKKEMITWQKFVLYTIFWKKLNIFFHLLPWYGFTFKIFCKLKIFMLKKIKVTQKCLIFWQEFSKFHFLYT